MPASDDLTRAIARALNDAQISLATHKRGAKTLSVVRSSDPERFLPTFCNAVLPVLLEYKVRRTREEADYVYYHSTRRDRAGGARGGGGEGAHACRG